MPCLILFNQHRDTYFIEEMENKLKKRDDVNMLIALRDFASPGIVWPTLPGIPANMELPPALISAPSTISKMGSDSSKVTITSALPLV